MVYNFETDKCVCLLFWSYMFAAIYVWCLILPGNAPAL